MSNIQKEILLREISEWSTEDVVALLTKNKLSECCSAIIERQVDGEELLHLSEGKLNLWKDLTRNLRWDLCRFVENLINNPKQYCPEEIRSTSPVLTQSEVDSSSGSWSTDFEEGEPGEDSLCEDHDDSSDMYGNGNITRPTMKVNPNIPGNKMEKEVKDDDNGNSNSNDNDDDSIYANGPSMVEKLQKKLMQRELNKKPLLFPKPNVMAKRPNVTESPMIKPNVIASPMKKPNGIESSMQKPNVTASPVKKPNVIASPMKKPNGIESSMKKPNVIASPMKKPNGIESPMKNPNVIVSPMKKQALPPPRQESPPVINNSVKPTLNLESIKRIETGKIAQAKKILCPPKPKITPPITPAPDESKFKKFAKLQNLPQPPSTFPRMKDTKFTNNSSTEKTDDSDEYDYEPINKLLNSPWTNVKQSNSSECLVSGSRSENALHSPTSSSSIDDDNQDVYEIISEAHDSIDEYEKPLFDWRSAPRPTQTGSMPKRPTDRKTATVPGIGRQPSRPLPLLPINGQQPDKPVEIPDRNFDAPLYTEKPWFHNVGRDEAIAMIEGGSSRFSNGPPDGFFLLRPSNANMNQPWTLVLWYKTKVYNIAVRKRPDSQYALGKVKPKELPFKSIEALVSYYKQNELVLNSGSGDVVVGSTRLTETPTK